MVNNRTRRSVLISGASIAGPTLAYWLDRYGFDVTVVEKAPQLRGGGYAIDIRGTARDVVDRMGLLPELRKAHVDTRRVSFVNPDGSFLAAHRNEAVAGGTAGLDLEVRRGDLATSLYGVIRDRVELRFGDSIAALQENADHVDITFDSGDRRTFDLVIGADGLHSNTRRLTFGPEEPYHRYLGFCFGLCELPNDFGLAHEAVIWNTPGRAGVLYAHEEDEPVFGVLNFAVDEPPFGAHRDRDAQRDLVTAAFPDDAWEIPRLVAAMQDADDLFFDTVSQIHMPSWSTGRVALTGDAAHATSFLSGQGSSVALVGAYVLAGELATRADHADAFAAYERIVRPFAETNQALATSGYGTVTPRTQQELEERNAVLRGEAELPSGVRVTAASTALTLPDYPDAG